MATTVRITQTGRIEAQQDDRLRVSQAGLLTEQQDDRLYVTQIGALFIIGGEPEPEEPPPPEPEPCVIGTPFVTLQGNTRSPSISMIGGQPTEPEAVNTVLSTHTVQQLKIGIIGSDDA